MTGAVFLQPRKAASISTLFSIKLPRRFLLSKLLCAFCLQFNPAAFRLTSKQFTWQVAALQIRAINGNKVTLAIRWLIV